MLTKNDAGGACGCAAQGSKRHNIADELRQKGKLVRVGLNMEGIHIIDPERRVRGWPWRRRRCRLLLPRH